MTNNTMIGLKSHYIIARGIALRLKTGRKIVRAMAFIKKISLFRTKWVNAHSTPNNVFQFRPQEAFCLEHCITADGCPGTSFTQGDVSGVPPETLPWARIGWPFRPTKNALQDLSAKITSPQIYWK